MDNQNPADPNQGGMGGGMPTDPNQGGQPAPEPVADPNAGQPAPEAPESTPEQPGVPGGDTGMGGDQGGPVSPDQGGQNPAGGAPVV